MNDGGIELRFKKNWTTFSIDVDLRLPGRGITALFGASGSGKTTVLRYMAGLDNIPGGFMNFKGNVWHDQSTWLPPHKRALGYVFQETSLFPHLSVTQNLRYGLKRCKNAGSRLLEQVIGLLGIDSLLERRIDKLSGGERQRVAIARALASNPELLLMDEPLAALDHARKLEILPFLEKLHGKLEIPIVYVSHSPEEVMRLADHLVVIERGRIVSSGTLAQSMASIDAPIRPGGEPAVVIDAVIDDRDARWSLSRADFPGGSLWSRDCGHPTGQAVRLRIMARDVSLSLSHRNNDSSILNSIQGRIERMGDDDHPGLVLIRVAAGGITPILARLSRRSVFNLKLNVGDEVWIQIKSVSVVK